MKILAFVDSHGNTESLKKLIERAKKDDINVVICAGDISVFGDKLNKLVEMVSKIKKPFLVIHGNHESEEEIEKACKPFNNCINIHKAGFSGANFTVLGYGGGGFSKVDKNFEKISKVFKKIIKERAGHKIILVTHAPPYNTNVDKIGKNPVGNKSIRNFISEVKPDLVICGHLHENANKKDKIGKTLIINPGYKGKVIEIK
ncbi:metallophosphoesterase [Candidatus Woesearchaeota archaeon]|nr:metallophosphoesterase [Candidatus Woesearchaeota archaeon]